MELNRKTEKIAGGGTDSILVTGGAGFIGSNFVLDWLAADGGIRRIWSLSRRIRGIRLSMAISAMPNLWRRCCENTSLGR
jgi:hypothetical protein